MSCTAPHQYTATQYVGEGPVRSISFADRMMAGDTIAGTPTLSCEPAGSLVFGQPVLDTAKQIVQFSCTCPALPAGYTSSGVFFAVCSIVTTNGEPLIDKVGLQIIQP